MDAEIAEYLEDETDMEEIEMAVWFDLGLSCLYQIVHHLLVIREDVEDDSEKEIYSKIISAYRGIGEMTGELLDHHSPEGGEPGD